MTLIFLLFVLCLPITVNGQVKISTITYHFDKASAYDSFSFPFIHCSNEQVAKKINLYLQRNVLDNSVIQTNPKKIFENSRFIDNDSVHQSGITSISYLVGVSNFRILSLKFDFETMRAYPETNVGYYNFNVLNGNVITAKDLFTSSGIIFLKKYLIKERQKRIDQFIKEEYSNGDTTYLRDTYTECNSDADEENVFIKQNSLLFYKNYCFPHVARPFDINLDIELQLNELGNYFTDFAKLIFQHVLSLRK